MREHVNHMDQRRFVTRMNCAFTEQSVSGIFATALVCTFFSPTNDLSICNAGHPPPLLYRASERRWVLLEEPSDATPAPTTTPENLPLGILDIASYEQFKVRLADGDRVFCYTDSLIEARDGAGRMLGVQGLLDHVNALPPETTTDAFIPALYASLTTCAGATLLNDDLTMLLFTPNAATRHVSFLSRAMAPIRLVARGIAWRRDGTRRMPFPELTIANLGGAIFPSLSRRVK
jgi:serine phosphatase RsbU (regulator of sigma subunit)